MTRIVLIALAAVAALMLITPPPASAQPYGWGPPRYEDDYDDWRPRRPPPRRWRDDDDWDRGGWGRPRPRGERYGSVCVTSRGNCNAGFRAPRNTPCRCFIPGFGEKRGAIGY
ncbi:hypothetical protein IMF23_05280 [Chelatococcus daeguensis]|nr:hypothetical protein [Chelatococcus daeguensis]